MARKHRYQLQCPIARALDVLGDRWSLLILRDLHAAPAGFQEMAEGLGIATNLLSTRLTELTDAGLIHKPDQRRGPYALTELGDETERLIWELAQFGSQLDPEPDPRDPGTVRALVLPLRVALRSAEKRPSLTVRIHFPSQHGGDEHITVISSPEALDVEYGGSLDGADLVLRTSYTAFLDVGEGRLSLEDFGAEHLEILEGPQYMAAFVTLIRGGGELET